METTCQQTPFEILSAAFAALESVTRRQYALLVRLADSAPDVLLAAMTIDDRTIMPLLAQRAQAKKT
jgi:hypothetical protein